MIFDKIFVSKKIFQYWLSTLLLKICFASFLPLAADENYYWTWSQKLQLSYFDHPGMVAWLFKLGNVFINFGSAIRIPSVLLSHLTLLIWFQILKPFLDEQKISLWLLLALTSPILGIGSMIATPDIPLLFFWSLAIYAFQNYLTNPKRSSALLLGVALGLGFCSKYPIVLFVPLAIASLVIIKPRLQIRLLDWSLIFFAGLIFSLPVLIWNLNNNFVSFLFQLHHGLGRPAWDPSWTLTYVLGQILLIFPLIFWHVLRTTKKTDAPKHWQIFAWGPLIFFTLTSFRGVVEANWPLVAYPSFYALFIIATPSLRTVRIAVGFWISLAFIFSSQIFFPWLPFKIEKLSEFKYYQPVLRVSQKYEPLFAENYQMASYLWFQTQKPIYKLHKMSRIDHFDWLPESLPQKIPFYLAMDKDAGLPDWIAEQNLTVTLQEQLTNDLVINRVDSKK